MMETKKKAVSVRLTPEAAAKCEHAKANGYNQTDFINQAILELPYYDRQYEQKLLPSFCAIADLASEINDTEIREALREEVSKICRFLRSYRSLT